MIEFAPLQDRLSEGNHTPHLSQAVLVIHGRRLECAERNNLFPQLSFTPLLAPHYLTNNTPFDYTNVSFHSMSLQQYLLGLIYFASTPVYANSLKSMSTVAAISDKNQHANSAVGRRLREVCLVHTSSNTFADMVGFTPSHTSRTVAYITLMIQ